MSLFSSLQARRRAEIFREMFQRAHDWIWRESAESTERTEFHGVAKIFQHSDVRRASLARPDLVNGFDAARRTDTTWRAFAAGFDGTELHRKPRLLCHVHCVVEDHDAAVTDQAILRGEGFIIERRVEQRAREIGAERATDLNSADGTAGKRATSNVVDQFAECDAEGYLEQTAVLDVAGELDRHGSA